MLSETRLRAAASRKAVTEAKARIAETKLVVERSKEQLRRSDPTLEELGGVMRHPDAPARESLDVKIPPVPSSHLNRMTDPHITAVDTRNHHNIVLELSDGRTLVYSLENVLTLTPDEVITDKEADELG